MKSSAVYYCQNKILKLNDNDNKFTSDTLVDNGVIKTSLSIFFNNNNHTNTFNSDLQYTKVVQDAQERCYAENAARAGYIVVKNCVLGTVIGGLVGFVPSVYFFSKVAFFKEPSYRYPGGEGEIFLVALCYTAVATSTTAGVGLFLGKLKSVYDIYKKCPPLKK